MENETLVAGMDLEEYKFLKRAAKKVVFQAQQKGLDCSSTDLNDLVQVGLIASQKARKKYNPDHGAKFETYAYRAIQQAMREEIRRQVCQQKGITRNEYYSGNHPTIIPPDYSNEQDENEAEPYCSLNGNGTMDMNLLNYELKRDLEHLPCSCEYKSMVLDRVFEELSWAEISRKYKIHQKQVKRIIIAILVEYLQS